MSLYFSTISVYIFWSSGYKSGDIFATHDFHHRYSRLNDFKAVVARNPATNVILGFISDIPDWALVESGFLYEGLAAVADNMEVVNKMIDVSPMKNIKNVKAPTLLLLGKKDLRVPPSQGLSYYHALKELNVPTKLFYYEDNHSLGTVPVEMDSIINSVIWFQRCLKKVAK